MKDLDTYFVHEAYFSTMWYILWPFAIISWLFGIFFVVLVCCSKKNLATLVQTDKKIWRHFVRSRSCLSLGKAIIVEYADPILR
jgi:hypothetical protein